jgi:hypothetical protein
MIIWREKLLAFVVHFALTLLVAAGAAALIFLVWFPDPFQTMVGGTRLFVLIVGCDLALGPLISLVIYNSRKTRRSLIIDYTIVGIVQLAAVIYGIHAISQWRPVYVVFVGDRYEIVSAGDIDPVDLKAAKEPYNALPRTGPRLVAAQVPQGTEAHNKALFDALAGKDIQLVPAYYVTYESLLGKVRERAKRLGDLEKVHPESKSLIDTGVKQLGVSADQLLWLPVKSRTGFWTALIDAKTGEPVKYLAFDPYE